MLGGQISQAEFSGDEPRPGVGRRGRKLPWTVGRKEQESVWTGVGRRVRRRGGGGWKSHLNLILSHR